MVNTINSTIHFHSCQFIDNKSRDFAGAILISLGKHIIITNSTFNNNIVELLGGACYIYQKNQENTRPILQIENSTFIEN